MQAPPLIGPVQSFSIAYHTGCPGARYDALGQPSVRSLGSSGFLIHKQALYVQDADTISNQEGASSHQELPEVDASAEPIEPMEPTEPAEPPVAKEPTNDTDAFTVPIESIGAVTEGGTAVPDKAAMAKISFGMACILLSIICDKSE